MTPKLQSPLKPAKFPPGTMKKGLGRTTVCTTAILLISSAAANIVFGMQGGDIDLARTLWTIGGLVAGGGIIFVFHCHSMLDGGK